MGVPARAVLSLKQGPLTQHAFLTAGGWLVPGTSTLCPPASSHPQFGGSLSLPSTHGCERYPALRNHRSSPYPSPYAHRNNSPSRFCVLSWLIRGWRGGGTPMKRHSYRGAGRRAQLLVAPEETWSGWWFTRGL